MYLFGWRCDQIDPVFKPLAYHHLYSFTSVRCVVHWFQVRRTACASGPGAPGA
jgi:lysosomal acid lipase/cholesteryl ester hydrolase